MIIIGFIIILFDITECSLHSRPILINTAMLVTNLHRKNMFCVSICINSQKHKCQPNQRSVSLKLNYSCYIEFNLICSALLQLSIAFTSADKPDITQPGSENAEWKCN